MKAVYDEALLKIAWNSNTATIFSWYQSTELHRSCRVFIALANRMAFFYYFSAHLADILRQKVFLMRYCVGCSPPRRYLRVFLSLYRANRKISKFVYKLFLFADRRLFL